MPVYEYRCGVCRHKFELLRSFSAADNEACCPECGASEARRLVSAFASFSKSSDGSSQSVGGSSCSSCASSNCASCH